MYYGLGLTFFLISLRGEAKCWPEGEPIPGCGRRARPPLRLAVPAAPKPCEPYPHCSDPKIQHWVPDPKQTSPPFATVAWAGRTTFSLCTGHNWPHRPRPVMLHRERGWDGPTRLRGSTPPDLGPAGGPLAGLVCPRLSSGLIRAVLQSHQSHWPLTADEPPGCVFAGTGP